jgi:hypothetical protein
VYWRHRAEGGRVYVVRAGHPQHEARSEGQPQHEAQSERNQYINRHRAGSVDLHTAKPHRAFNPGEDLSLISASLVHKFCLVVANTYLRLVPLVSYSPFVEKLPLTTGSYV